MKNILNRIALVLVVVPLLYLTAWYGTFLHSLPLSLLVVVFSGAAGMELVRILEPSATKGRRAAAAALSGAPALAAYAARFLQGGSLVSSWLGAMGTAILFLFLLAGLPKAFAKAGSGIREARATSSADALLMLYPGALSSALIPIVAAPAIGGGLAIWFSIVVFANDSLAWLVGITLGRHRGIFSVSPNKSLEGLLAGLVGSVLGCMAGDRKSVV